MNNKKDNLFSNMYVLKRLHYMMLKPIESKYGKSPYDKDFTELLKETYQRMVLSENPEEEYERLYNYLNIIDVNVKDEWIKNKQIIKDDFLKKNNNNFDNNIEINKIRHEVYQFLWQKEKNKATELITEYLKKNYKFYSIRNNIAPEIWVYQEGIYIETGISIIKEVSRNILLKAYSSHLGNNIISKIEADCFINADDFFNNNEIEYVPVKNGLLHIFKKKLIDFTPNKIFFNKLPVEFVPGIICPNIIKHFETVLKNPKDIDTIQELFGDMLRKEYKYEKGVMFNGSGRNGKGKTLNLIKCFLGEKNCANVTLEQLENDQYAIGNLFGKMVNLAGDLGKTALKTTGRFKNCIGRDGITANRKNKSHLDFINYAKMFFACNELPITYDNTEGFWSKWIYFDFPYKFIDKEEYEKLDDDEKKFCKIKDPNIIKALTTEKELTGLLNWALIGLERLDKQNKFSDSQTSEEIKKIWIRKSDSFRAFCMDCVIEDYENHLSKQEFKIKFIKYCKDNKLKPTSDIYIKSILSEIFGCYEQQLSYDGERIRCWLGINFKRPAQGTQEEQYI